MKKHLLSLVLILGAPLAFSSDDVEEGPTSYGCGGCSNNQSIYDEIYRQQMESAAAAAEAQRALAAQQQAQARAAALEAERRRQAQECGQKKGSISGSLSGCKSTASSVKSRAYSNCPVETEVTAGINVGLGNVTVTTSPRKTCTENADVAYIAAIDMCEANASRALAALPSYCY